MSFHDENEKVYFDKTPQHFGGARNWFLCPRCQRRCIVLYGGSHFRCRICSNATYRTQREDAYARALTKAFKKRRTLGGLDGGLDDPLPVKPKGMHKRTYQQLSDRYQELENIVLARLDTYLDQYR